MEIKKIFASNNIKRVLSSTDELVGYIAGWSTNEEIFCTSVAGGIDYFLTGLEVNGIYSILNNIPTSDNEYIKLCEHYHGNLNVNLEAVVVLFVTKSCIDEEDVNITAKLYSPYYNTLSNLEIEYINNTSSVLLRAQGQIPCVIEIISDMDLLKENIDQSLEKAKSIFKKQVGAFLLKNTNAIIQCSKEGEISCSAENVKKLLKLIPEEESSGKSKGKKNMRKKIPTEFDILIQITGDVAVENSCNHSMVIHCQRREFQCASVKIPLDVLIVCQETTLTSTVYKLFLKAIEQQLIQIKDCLIKYTTSSDIDAPVPYHFYPDMWDFPVTLIYPLKKPDKELESYRKELHKKLLLPLDRPFLKKLNRHELSMKSASGHLYNPHEGITSSGVQGGKSALVQGIYTYYHYMQDHMNDDGWGCAYRSLQTIISWFKHQGYTDKNVPTHEEIQKALVNVGDKPESFIGSRKWIGSQEVSFCLDHLINVQSRIMFVSSGAELASKGRELLNHFRDQGTPIMIGGGVLAHTILGVDFNQDTGDLKFLILDPHYTGKEDLNIILNKGWCGWKDLKFWDQTAFYNLCLPQRPKQI